MDLLGSIMNSMDKPPSLSEKEKNIIKKRKEEMDRRQAIEKENLRKFKEYTETKMKVFFENDENINMKFTPMNQIYRSIVHEVAESLDLISFSFGIEDVDRYVRVYRKANPPCEDELLARKRGDPWNDDIKKKMIEKRKLDQLESEELNKKPTKKFVPNTNYEDKYVHLIGEISSIEMARKTETNKTYGFVPSENKKDIRSIEQTMADIKAKKKLRQENESKVQEPKE
ncbi:sperm-associated antigen 7 [Onthophagus taurus]|uniref:sperm-associated antigen 7 n=1 Tax=Onthophagus taurus TaxID=166361 RepID=UPI000C1FE563|nr:sperm-associated antigen 7 [Onthophagus taurus]